MSVRRCLTCTHWGPPGSPHGEERVYANEHGIELRMCRFFTGTAHASHLAQAICWSEGIGGELMTAAEFGCVEWSEGPPAAGLLGD